MNTEELSKLESDLEIAQEQIAKVAKQIAFYKERNKEKETKSSFTAQNDFYRASHLPRKNPYGL